MIVLGCQHLRKDHGANTILADVTFEISEGERVGLIGRNGCGKTTLLQMVAGLTRPDEGQLSLQKRARVGYLPQVPVERGGMTVREVLELGFRELLACRALMAELEARMGAQADPVQLEPLLAQYAELQERFQREGGYEIEAQIQQVAAGLGIPREQFPRQYATLSGGEQTKVGLASLLLERPTLLLLDEPTNHLDTAGIEWLETFLTTYPGACLVVSHDRYFLDRVANRIVELEDGEAFTYETNYTGYLAEKEERLLQQFAEFKEQQKKIKQMQETIRQLQEWGRIGANEKFFRRAASMQKALDRMERVKRPMLERRAAEFDLQQSDRSGREVLRIESLSKQYGGSRPLLRQADAALQYGEKLALVGRNGAGKSTLFRLLLGQEQPDEGAITLGARVEIGYLAQQEHPTESKSVLQFYCEAARVESGEGRSQLARYLFYGEDVFRPVNLLSGGEWTRLRLALLTHQKPNLLLLDEPTNHLDVASREALEEALEEFPGTVLAISHDRYFINRIAGRVWELDGGKLASHLGNYDDYREKRLARELAAAAAATVAPVKAKPAPQAPAPRRQSSGKRAKEQLEQAIAQAEQQLAEADAALEQAQAGGDLDGLSRRWAEREALQQKLDTLYQQWMEAEEGSL